MLLRREGGLLKREGGFLRREGGFLRRGEGSEEEGLSAACSEGGRWLLLGSRKAWEWQCSSERSRKQFRTI